MRAKISWTLVLVLALAMASAGCGDRDMKADAYRASQRYVKRRLAVPLTASFPRYSEELVSDANADLGTYTVLTHVRAEDANGDMVRMSYVCTVQYDDLEERWLLLMPVMIGR